jgi:transcriptional regulator with XRE-family HTH domain
MTLFEIRKKKGLTTAQIAGQLGISRAHYSHLENGTRAFTEELLEKTAKILEIDKETIRNLGKVAEIRNLVPKSWLWSLKIDNKPFIKAFSEYLGTFSNKKSTSKQELLEMAVKFIIYRIEHSARQEFKENPEVLDFLYRKMGFEEPSI